MTEHNVEFMATVDSRGAFPVGDSPAGAATMESSGPVIRAEDYEAVREEASANTPEPVSPAEDPSSLAQRLQHHAYSVWSALQDEASDARERLDPVIAEMEKTLTSLKRALTKESTDV